ncbi:MAG: hypothetical protein KatS3mg029_0430 [Saprospiraceae bacterium]|nr:MAG: hypothetical protein KatS3mg029_0430 [Saprospiraceae bacterium]
MARITTLEEKKFIEEKVEAGWTSRQIAEKLGYSIWTVRKWRKHTKKTASHGPVWVDRQVERWALSM